MATLEALELLEGRKEGREWCDRIVCGKGVPRQGRKGEPVVPFQSIRGLREMPAWENYSPSMLYALQKGLLEARDAGGWREEVLGLTMEWGSFASTQPLCGASSC